jgi:hypothetical protein
MLEGRSDTDLATVPRRDRNAMMAAAHPLFAMPGQQIALPAFFPEPLSRFVRVRKN